MLARSCHTIPEPPTRLRDIQDEREQLDQADDYSDHDRDDGKHNGVVQDGDVVFCEGGGGVEGHH